MDGKKISFGFSKITKKPALLPNKIPKQEENQKELIKCLEGQQIKLVEEQKESAPLTIPLKEGGKTSAALASLAKRRAVLLGEEEESEIAKSTIQENSNGEQTEDANNIEKRAARELLAEVQAKNDETNETGLVLPVVKPDDLPLDGAAQSTLDDYETVPVSQYGWAMLRGMGAVEPPKSVKNQQVNDGPVLRPKGMGLGAESALKNKQTLVAPETNEKLEIKKQAFIRIKAGKFKDAYGQIEGFDDDSKVIVKLAIGGSKEILNEFLCQPVSKNEYAQYGKCLNKAKYEEYKKLENENGQIIIKREDNLKVKIEKTETSIIKSDMRNSRPSDDIDKRLKYNHNDYGASSSSRNNRNRSRSRSRSASLPKKYSSRRRYDSTNDESDSTSNDSSDSDDACERRKMKSKSHKTKHIKKKHHHRHHNSSDDSDKNKKYRHSFSDSDETTERHHKRDKKKKSKKKTKKSKRERSRTPNRRR